MEILDLNLRIIVSLNYYKLVNFFFQLKEQFYFEKTEKTERALLLMDRHFNPVCDCCSKPEPDSAKEYSAHQVLRDLEENDQTASAPEKDINRDF